MDIIFDLGTVDDLDELSQLYNDLNDYLENGVNYPGWKRGIYPVRQNALAGIKHRNLYVARYNEKIIGSIILNHEPEPAYNHATWQLDLDYCDVFVIHTFAVHPEFLKCGVGKALMDYSIEHGINSQIKSIRLDVHEGNVPAIKLYEKYGFKYVDTVDLGLEEYGLKWFKLYEKLL